MQEIYTMIQNTGVTLVIVVIFLWQYITDIKKKNEEEKENNKHLENIDKNTTEILKEIQNKKK